jgi:hypothetical protein
MISIYQRLININAVYHGSKLPWMAVSGTIGGKIANPQGG